MFKIGFNLSKYVIEGLELRFFLKYATMFSFTEHKISPVSLRPQSSRMHSYVLSNGQKHFVSHVFAMLQRWFFGTQFTFKLYRCKLLFYTMQKIPNLSSFSKLGSYLICLFTTGPYSLKKKLTRPIFAPRV